MIEPVVPPTAAKTPTSSPTTGLPDVKPLEGKVSVDEKLILEVELLAHAAASKLADEIASTIRKVWSNLHERVVVVGDPWTRSAVGAHKAFLLECKEIEQAFRCVCLPPPKNEHLATAAVTAVTAVLGLTSLFRQDVGYYGRAVTISDRALAAELIRALALIPNVQLLYPSLAFAPLKGKSSYCEAWEKVMNARLEACDRLNKEAAAAAERPSNEPPTAPQRIHLDLMQKQFEAADQSMRELAGLLRGRCDDKGPEYMNMLEIGERIDSALKPGKHAVYFLDARVESAGGSYRTRRNLWQTLFAAEGITVSGGAVVSYFVVDSHGVVVLAETLRYRWPHRHYEVSGAHAGMLGFPVGRHAGGRNTATVT